MRENGVVRSMRESMFVLVNESVCECICKCVCMCMGGCGCVRVCVRVSGCEWV